MIPIAIFGLADLFLIADAFSLSPELANGFVPLHLALTFAALLVWRVQARISGWNALAVPIGAAFGPCAMLAIYWVKPWSFVASRTAQRPARASWRHRKPKPKLYDSVTPMAVLARMLDRRITFPAADQIESLGAILRAGSLPSRRKALETAVRCFEPRLSPLIAAALQDDDQTIRALAAAASAQVSHNLSQQLDELDGRDHSFDLSYARAMLLFEHGCHNVLLPHTLRSKHRRAAFAELQECRRNAPAEDYRLDTIVDAISTLGLELAPAQSGKPRLVHPQELPAAHGS